MERDFYNPNFGQAIAGRSSCSSQTEVQMRKPRIVSKKRAKQGSYLCMRRSCRSNGNSREEFAVEV
jgi:hypothetical protein